MKTQTVFVHAWEERDGKFSFYWYWSRDNAERAHSEQAKRRGPHLRDFVFDYAAPYSATPHEIEEYVRDAVEEKTLIEKEN